MNRSLAFARSRMTFHHEKPCGDEAISLNDSLMRLPRSSEKIPENFFIMTWSLLIYGNVLKNGWCLFQFLCLKCAYQPEEEISSGGDQLVSNKVDAYTKKGVGHFIVQPLLFLVSYMA